MYLRWKRQTVTRMGARYVGCQHGVQTTRVIPQLLESFRDPATHRPKARHVWTGPSFRMCCVELVQQRCGWWWALLHSLRPLRDRQLVTVENWKRFNAQIHSVVPYPTEAERHIYERGLLDHMFRCRRLEGETWDEYQHYIWAEATRNVQDGVGPVEHFKIPLNVAFGAAHGYGVVEPDPLAESRAVLQLPEKFTEEQLKTAYRAAVKEHHPDLGGNAALFKLVTDAYENLKSLGNFGTPRRR